MHHRDAGTPDLRRQAGPHVFVDDLERLELSDHDRHHLTKVLRVRDGDPLTVSDGAGKWRNAVLGAALEPTGPLYVVPEPVYELCLGSALTKAAKPDFVVQKATELGIDRIIVFQTTHSVARWDETKRAKAQPRLDKIAREAAMQSRQVRIPRVEIAQGVGEVAALPGVMRADFVGIPTTSEHRCILIGPEGGWASEEVALIPGTVDLGTTVLRAETAAVVAAAFMTRSRDLAAAENAR